MEALLGLLRAFIEAISKLGPLIAAYFAGRTAERKDELEATREVEDEAKREYEKIERDARRHRDGTTAGTLDHIDASLGEDEDNDKKR